MALANLGRAVTSRRGLDEDLQGDKRYLILLGLDRLRRDAL